VPHIKLSSLLGKAHEFEPAIATAIKMRLISLASLQGARLYFEQSIDRRSEWKGIRPSECIIPDRDKQLEFLYYYWLGREDSNLRMAESKSAALPLGDAPKA
jgi:hypothetical protein